MGEQGRRSLTADEVLFLPTRWLWPVQWVTDFPNRLANRQEMGVRVGDDEEREGVLRGIRVQLVLRLNELWGRGWGIEKRWWLLPIERLRMGNIGLESPGT
jgi:hypothetical protein